MRVVLARKKSKVIKEIISAEIKARLSKDAKRGRGWKLMMRALKKAISATMTDDEIYKLSEANIAHAVLKAYLKNVSTHAPAQQTTIPVFLFFFF